MKAMFLPFLWISWTILKATSRCLADSPKSHRTPLPECVPWLQKHWSLIPERIPLSDPSLLGCKGSILHWVRDDRKSGLLIFFLFVSSPLSKRCIGSTEKENRLWRATALNHVSVLILPVTEAVEWKLQELCTECFQLRKASTSHGVSLKYFLMWRVY